MIFLAIARTWASVMLFETTDGPVQKQAQAGGDGIEAEALRHRTLGPAEMRAEHQCGPPLQQLQKGPPRTYPTVYNPGPAKK